MDATEFIHLTAGTCGTAGDPVSPDDELRALFEAQRLTRDLARRLGTHTTSPTLAALFTQVAEDGHRTAAHTQLLAAQAARRTLAHELPEPTFEAIVAIGRDPESYLQGTTALPADPATVPTGRPVFKDTTELLTGLLHISYFEARDRVRAIDLLLPGTDVHGNSTPARYPVLAQDLAQRTADPAQINAAARKLEKLTPHINRHPDPVSMAGKLEDQLAESVRHGDVRTTAKLVTGIRADLDKGLTDFPEDILRTKAGLFYRGTTAGLGEFLLRTLPRDTEALLALCASTDNPRTKAGDREALLNQALAAPTGSIATTTDNRSTASTAQPNTPTDQATDSGTRFPDFLIDPATGQPLNDPATIKDLSLDPEGLKGFGSLFHGNGDEDGNGPAASTTIQVLDPGMMNTTAYGSDGLTPPQRHLQGLMNLIKAAGTPRTGKKTIGLPSPKTLVIATLAELQSLAETHGITTRGNNLSPAELRQGLCNGGVLPLVMGGKSQVLDLGQEERLFPDYMREAILGIYGGCIMPGCTVPPEHCEIHHFDYFADGGKTEINSGAPGCSSHHHGFHTGLFTVIRDEDGLFSVILPKFLDPEQKPRRNTYWRNTQNTHLF